MKGTGTDMKHINSAVRLLDIAAEKYSDKIAVADEWGEISYGGLRALAMRAGAALIKSNAEGYMPCPVMACAAQFLPFLWSLNAYSRIESTIPF